MMGPGQANTWETYSFSGSIWWLFSALAAALLGVAGLAQAVDTYYVENPSLAWPGNRRTPMREMECFAIADYSKCTCLTILRLGLVMNHKQYM